MDWQVLVPILCVILLFLLILGAAKVRDYLYLRERQRMIAADREQSLSGGEE